MILNASLYNVTLSFPISGRLASSKSMTIIVPALTSSNSWYSAANITSKSIKGSKLLVKLSNSVEDFSKTVGINYYPFIESTKYVWQSISELEKRFLKCQKTCIVLLFYF